MAKSHCNQITLEQCLRSVSSFLRVVLPVLVLLLPSDLMLLRVWTNRSTVLLFLWAQFMDVHKELKQVLLFDDERFGGWQLKKKERKKRRVQKPESPNLPNHQGMCAGSLIHSVHIQLAQTERRQRVRRKSVQPGKAS